MKATRGQLAQLHIARKELGLDEETYRAALEGATGKRSSAEMTIQEASKAIRWFQEHGWSARKQRMDSGFRRNDGGKKRYEDLGDRPGMASPQQLRKIEAMWADLSYSQDRAHTLRTLLFKRWKCSDLRFLTSRQAWEVIEALKSMHQRIWGEGGRRPARENAK